VNPVRDTKPAALLVIGYGNTLRSDDGAGHAVALEAQARFGSELDAIAVHQLTPELASVCASAEKVIFVDAAVAELRQVRVQAIERTPPGLKNIEAHSMSPSDLLALTELLFRHRPQAWIITLPAPSLGWGECFSPKTSEAIEQSIRLIADHLHDRTSSTSTYPR
jgi:hydrogenase maturation protease